ncbi:MAG TPA: ABC transporter substrate-binding protein [Methanoregulaceae archaeon]|nr:ABC transporter substrate-binding protein [Methanoregulaceae archaeon]HPD76000.1 ABC transporter substrate-binding protein [Methanoregulaceae archaeon]HRY76111.1 ABC transporter substrate-binding protein [Methanoregulaceae archaeon]
MKLLNLTAVAALALLLVLAAGCTQTTTPPSEKTTIKELKFGYQPSTHQMAFTTAMAKGWWMEDLAPLGVENVSDKVFPSGPPEMQAMLAGDLDVAYVGAAPVISAISTGLDAKIVAGVNNQGSDLVVRPDLTYTGPEALKGLKIATFQAGSIQDTILRDWLKQNNIDPEKDVQILGMGPGDAVTAITAGKVDAVFLPTPSPSTIVAQGKGKIVVRSGEMYPNHTCCVLVVSGKLIRENPEIVKQIIKTNDKAVAFNLANRNEAAGIFATKTGAKLDDVLASLAEWDGQWTSDPNLIVDSVVDYAQIQYDLGYIKTPLTKDQLFDLSFYQKS